MIFNSQNSKVGPNAGGVMRHQSTECYLTFMHQMYLTRTSVFLERLLGYRALPNVGKPGIKCELLRLPIQSEVLESIKETSRHAILLLNA